MADEKITVEWIATANQMLGTIQKIDQRKIRNILRVGVSMPLEPLDFIEI